MPKNNNQTMPQPYDPVPPYDLDDVEANAASTHSTANLFTLSQTNADDAEYDVGNHEGSGSNIIDPIQNTSDGHERHRKRGGREGKLTERECCDYAFLYFKTVVLGVVMMTFFISLFAYLGRKKGN